jgi:hypothetical protein
MHTQATTRALARLTGDAVRLADTIKAMQRIAAALPLTIQLEVNNLQEVTDLLRFKLHEETLAGVIHAQPEIPLAARATQKGKLSNAG